MKALLSITAAALLCAPAWAGDQNLKSFFNGNDLQVMCERHDMRIYGYVTGTIDTASLFSSAAAKRLCVPDNVTSEQVTDAVCKWLGEHPELRQHQAASLVGHAMIDSFCHQSNGAP